MRTRVWLVATILCAACAASSESPVDWPRNDKPTPLGATSTQSTEPAPQVDTGGRDVKGESVAIEGSDLVRGRAKTVVNASIEQARKEILDYGSYVEFMPHYAGSRVLGPKGDGREVYMQWKALGGAVKLWARFAMMPKKDADGREMYESSFLDGNVETAYAAWRLKSMAPDKTEIELEIYLKPKLPLPPSILNHENTQGAMQGVTAMADKIEGKPITEFD
jgi:ribosome-associated toxin RatA of RatAB toxin-antitoxin module